MAARKTKRSPHPGVVLLKPRPEHYQPNWRARFRDPDSGKTKTCTLPRLDARTAETRRAWATKKSKALARRRMELEAGAVRMRGVAITEVLERFFEDREAELRPGTIGLYRVAQDVFLEWAAEARIRSADDLTKAQLMAFRAWLGKRRKRAPAKGRARGEHTEGRKRLSPASLNRDLRHVRAILNHARRIEALPRLDRDAITDSLTGFRTDHEAPKFLRPKEVRHLLEAAIEHDAERYTATREEHAGRREPGSTYRYEPISPFVLTLLLSGMRLSEGLKLEWQSVDLEAGQIRLEAAETKTRKHRTIDLSVSPTLIDLFEMMQEWKPGRYVFGGDKPLSLDRAKAAARRLLNLYDAPDFTWHGLRRTCGTVLVCAPGIYGGASIFMAAKRLGHSVEISERNYAGHLTRLPARAITIEAAIGIEGLCKEVVDVVERRSTVE